MKLLRRVGSTSEIWQIFIQDSSSTTGAALTGLTNASSSLTAYYHRDTDTTATVINLVTMTVGTFTSSGFKEIDSTNMPGWYQFCPPNAALASGAKSCSFHLKGATNMAPLPIEVDLDGQVDVYLWNGTAVSSPATAGIPDVNAKNINNVSTSSVTTINANLGTTQVVTFNANNFAKVSLNDILATTLTETSGQLTGGFKKFFNVAAPASTMELLTAVTTVTTTTTATNLTNAPTAGDFTSTMKTSIGTAVAASAVASVTGNVSGSVGSIASGGITDASFATGTGKKVIRANTAAAGAASSITLDASASATDNIYNDCLIYLTGGTGIGQTRLITAYVGSTQVASVAPNWQTNPDNTTTFAILPSARVDISHILGTLSAGTAGYTGPDWGHVNAPTTTVNLSGTTVNLVNTLTTYTGDTPQTGDSFARIGATGSGLTSLAPSSTALSTATWTGSLATNLGTLAGHDPGTTIGTGTSTLTQTQVTGGAYSIQSASCVLGDARIAHLDADITSRAPSATALSTTQWTNSLATNLGTLAGHDPGATLASQTNITAGIVTTVSGNVTGSVGSIASNGITDASFALGTGKKVVRANTATAGANSSITLDASASATDSVYNDCIIYLTGGTGAGQARLIVGYVGSTQVATIAPNWQTNPDNTTTFAILPGTRGDISHILGTLSAGSAGYMGVDWSHVNAPTSTVSLTNTTIATVTNLTNAASSGDFTSTMKTSLNAATPAVTVSDKTGFSLANSSFVTATFGVCDFTSTMKSSITTAASSSTPSVTVSDKTGFSLAANQHVIVDSGTITTLSNLPSIPNNWLTASGIASGALVAAVWDGTISGHTTSGTFGGALNSAGSAGDPWNTNLPGAYAAGTAGFIVGTNLDALISSRSTYAGGDTSGTTTLLTRVTGAVALAGVAPSWYTTPVDVSSNVSAIKAKTDNLPASPAAIGSAMTLASNSITTVSIQDGAYTEAKFTMPGEAAGRPTGLFSILRRVWEWVTNKRTRDRNTGTVLLRNSTDTSTLETQTQSTSGTIDTQSQGG